MVSTQASPDDAFLDAFVGAITSRSRAAQQIERTVGAMPQPLIGNITFAHHNGNKPAFSANSTQLAEATLGLNEPPQLSAIDKAVERLLKLESLPEDWSGMTASAAVPESIRAAKTFLRSLAPDSNIPGATLHANGHTILFLKGDDQYAELEFLDDNKIGFYVRRGEKRWDDEFTFDGLTLPGPLLEVGFNVLPQ